MFYRVAGLLDPDADFKRGAAHMIDSRVKMNIPRHVRNMTDRDIVNGCGYHPGLGKELVDIAEGGLFRYLVENLQQQPEAYIGLDRFVKDHEAPP